MLIGHQVLRYTQVTSTNDIAWQYASDLKNHGLVVVAEEQTAGRGRRGDQWMAPPGSALLLSMLLQPPVKCRRPVIMTLWAALGVCQVIHQTLNIIPRLKWPNDILLESRKVCGILVEQRKDWFVIGVGLNVQMPAGWLQSSRLMQACSLNEFTESALSREQLLDSMLVAWNNSYEELVSSKCTALLESWRDYSQLIGQEVMLEAAGKQYRGVLISLDWDHIVMEIDGIRHQFVPETIIRLQLTSD